MLLLKVEIETWNRKLKLKPETENQNIYNIATMYNIIAIYKFKVLCIDVQTSQMLIIYMYTFVCEISYS